MAESDDELRSHVLTYVARDFAQRRGELRQGRQREHGRLHNLYMQEVRSFAANREEAENRGPPYAVAETVFDEDDQEACEPVTD